MKDLVSAIEQSMIALRDRPGLLPRGAETYDWRAVAAHLRDRSARDREGAKGLTAERDRAILLAHADAMEAAAKTVEAEAKRKGLA